MRRVIFWLFAILFFFVPLILWPYTSEVFEFNKIVSVYLLTTLIAGVWIVRMIAERKFIFRRTILDIPLLVFMGSQIISTFLSIDSLTSWLGYYSRFNGGLASILCYSLLYWAFVSNLDKDDSTRLIKYSLLPSALIVSIYGILEHFGIDKNVWVQDVQTRVFSSLGQPNWLAAWLTALIPVTWVFMLNSKLKSVNFWIYFLAFTLFFWTLIFTKSRSGLLGFGVAFLMFWGWYFWTKRKEYKKHLTIFPVISLSILFICLISGTELTPSIYSLVSKAARPAEKPAGETSLETGGTESGTIRKIVWKGAIQVWLHYPVFGTGVETFAYSYYKYRPAEHNLTSEWDFIYNKAHNEYLNMAANSGTFGLASYLALITFSVILMFKTESQLNLALLTGYVSLLVTNFFGFSVVATELQFFLFPGVAIALTNIQQTTNNKQLKKLENVQKAAMLVVVGCLLIVVFAVGKYWYADTLFAKGKAYNSRGKPDVASNLLTQAITLEPNQALYHSELANAYTNLALSFYQQKDAANTKKLADAAIGQSDRAMALSPANINFKRSRFGVFIMLSVTDPNYLVSAGNTLLDAIKGAPTDAKLYYNLGLTYARTGQPDQALSTFQKAIELKANYKEARLAYAILLINGNQIPEARRELEYILAKIDPNDSLTKQTLEGIR